MFETVQILTQFNRDYPSIEGEEVGGEFIFIDISLYQ
jgi:hypothetical protein